jgi:hypothetical protein
LVHLTVPFALRYILKSKGKDSANSNICPAAWSSDLISGLSVEIENLIRTKLADGKKPRKNEEPTELDVDSLDLSPNFCKSIPVQLIQRALVAVTRSDLNLVRYGYVLDVYDYDIITSMEDLKDIAPRLEFLVDIHVSPIFVNYLQ